MLGTWVLVAAVVLAGLWWLSLRHHHHWADLGVPFEQGLPFFGISLNIIISKKHTVCGIYLKSDHGCGWDGAGRCVLGLDEGRSTGSVRLLLPLQRPRLSLSLKDELDILYPTHCRHLPVELHPSGVDL